MKCAKHGSNVATVGKKRLRCKSCQNESRQNYISRNLDEYRQYCRENTKKWRTANPSRNNDIAKKSYKLRRDKIISRKHGISVETLNGFRSKQNNACAICERETDLRVDHCHKSLTVRGLLCHKCNVGLGLFNDDFNLLKKAMLYLEKMLYDAA